MSNQKPDDAALERDKWQSELGIRKEELQLKEREQHNQDQLLELKRQELAQARWNTPLIVALIAAATAGVINILLTFVNGSLQREADAKKAEIEQRLQISQSDTEQKLQLSKAESDRILEVIKTGNNLSVAKTNLEFLIDTGLLQDRSLAGRIKQYITLHPDRIPVLPAAGGPALPDCDLYRDVAAKSEPLLHVRLPPDHQCHFRPSHGYVLPDPSCTPGAINPALDRVKVSKQNIPTICLRDQGSSRPQKEITYSWYKVAQAGHGPVRCQLDHLIPLILGGADTLENIWPHCGAEARLKDRVESYVTKQVHLGAMTLAQAQHGLATDWTQYVQVAQQAGKPVSAGH